MLEGHGLISFIITVTWLFTLFKWRCYLHVEEVVVSAFLDIFQFLRFSVGQFWVVRISV